MTTMLQLEAGLNEDGSIDVTIYEPKQPSFAVEGMFLLKEANVVYGTGSAAKSTLIADMCVNAVLGLPWLGRKTVQGGVLYLDWESSADTVTWRIRRIAKTKGQQMPRGRFIYKRMRHPILDIMEKDKSAVRDIEVLVGRYQPRYLIIDSLGFAMGGDTQKESLVLQVFEVLSKIVEGNDVCLIFIDHTPHADKEKEYGSEYKRNAVRSQWLLKEAKDFERTSDGEVETVYVALENKKNNFRVYNASIHIRVEFHDTYENVEDDGLNLPDGPIIIGMYDPIPTDVAFGANKEYQLLDAMPGKARELVGRTGIDAGYAKKLLRSLKSRGLAVNDEFHTWRRTAKVAA